MVAEHEIGQRTDELIAKWIVLGEYDGPHEAWTKDHGTPVWVQAARLPVHSFVGREGAAEYGLPWEAFQAAMAFSDRHKAVRDAKVLLNQSRSASRSRMWPLSISMRVSHEMLPSGYVSSGILSKRLKN